MLRLMVDFNEIRDGIVTGLTEDVTGAPRALIGDRVVLHDDGEHEMSGIVTGVRSGLVDATVEWTTWHPVRPATVNSWKQRVPELISAALPAQWRPLPTGAYRLPPVAHPWSGRFGESTNVCAEPAPPTY